MDFAFSDEQQMLFDSTRRFLAERYDFDTRNRIRASEAGWSSSLWREIADLGLLSIHVPERDGGMGADPVAGMLVAQAAGDALLLEPLLSSAVLATRAIAALGDASQRARWLPPLAAGELIAVLAHEETSTRFAPFALQTRAVAIDGGYELHGRKTLVHHAPLAGLLLVSAALDEEIALFAVPADSPGLQLETSRSIDDQIIADVILERVRVGADARLGGNARDALQAVLDYGLAMLCGEAFGVMDRLLSATIEYSRNRVQFGTPIGRLQALQHRMAEMLMHLEQARSMCFLAATRCEDEDPATRATALSAAKVLTGQAARYIGQQAVQLHGGMGMTDELAVSHGFRRLLAFELRGGSGDWHLARYARDMRAA